MEWHDKVMVWHDRGMVWHDIVGVWMAWHDKGMVWHGSSDFIWDFGMLPFPFHFGKSFKEFGKKSQKYPKLGK